MATFLHSDGSNRDKGFGPFDRPRERVVATFETIGTVNSTDDTVDGTEWWDVVDAEGTSTGATHRRGAPGWPTGRFHLIVAACVYRDDGTILLTQRAATKSEFPLAWEFPGGSALAGESSREAAARELREETGIDVAPSDLVQVNRFTEQSALLDIYVAREPAGALLALQESEVMAAEWVTPEEVTRRLDAGLMAEPWVDRLESLWTPILRALPPGARNGGTHRPGVGGRP